MAKEVRLGMAPPAVDLAAIGIVARLRLPQSAGLQHQDVQALAGQGGGERQARGPAADDAEVGVETVSDEVRDVEEHGAGSSP